MNVSTHLHVESRFTFSTLHLSFRFTIQRYPEPLLLDIRFYSRLVKYWNHQLNNPLPNANPIPVAAANTNPVPHNDPNTMGSLNEGDAASFSEQPTKDAPNIDTAMGDAPANDPPTTDSKQKAPLEPQPLNTIYPIPEDDSDEEWDATDDGVPSPTAQQIKKIEAELPPAPAPAPPNRGTKRRSPIQVSLPPKKSKPSGSTPKAGMSSSKNSPAAADSQPRRGK
ncbi:hypothetical protein HRI_001405900 [Hibiscus trionum]|uniref:Uncharacterized protein n=1 Tax=Hibiscus trionum TaxID=183268 RepID=A0A9W7HHM3_HIBTR|nr:hypothetical protein HRI_001405900 [Hibiscus trionum]